MRSSGPQRIRARTSTNRPTPLGAGPRGRIDPRKHHAKGCSAARSFEIVRSATSFRRAQTAPGRRPGVLSRAASPACTFALVGPAAGAAGEERQVGAETARAWPAPWKVIPASCWRCAGTGAGADPACDGATTSRYLVAVLLNKTVNAEKEGRTRGGQRQGGAVGQRQVPCPPLTDHRYGAVLRYA